MQPSAHLTASLLQSHSLDYYVLAHSSTAIAVDLPMSFHSFGSVP
jgi:hypothetical protein